MNNSLPNEPEQKGFATTPLILRGAGPQMEDYPDFDSWQFARRVYAMGKMGVVNPQMKEHAESLRIKR